MEQVARKVKDQNTQSNADEAPIAVNEIPNNSISYTVLLPYTGQKVKAFNVLYWYYTWYQIY